MNWRMQCLANVMLNIGYLQGIRPSTYFPDSIVAHAMFGDPFSNKLLKLIQPLVESVIPTLPSEGSKLKLHVQKTAVVMEGWAASTRLCLLEADLLSEDPNFQRVQKAICIARSVATSS